MPGRSLFPAAASIPRANATGARHLRTTATRRALAGTSAPTIRLTLVSFDCFADEVYISSTLQPHFPAAAVSGPWVVPAEEAIAAQSLDFPLQLPFDLQPDDPHRGQHHLMRQFV